MNHEIVFSETQRAKRWFVGVVLWVSLFMLFLVVFPQVFWGREPLSNFELLLFSGVLVLVNALLFIGRLDTRIQKDGIYVRFFPFHRRWRHYPWGSLTQAYVRPYSPLLEYGGWGFRIGVFGHGNALNIAGNQGLQLEFQDRRKLLIGTARPEELTQALISLGKLTPKPQ